MKEKNVSVRLVNSVKLSIHFWTEFVTLNSIGHTSPLIMQTALMMMIRVDIRQLKCTCYELNLKGSFYCIHYELMPPNCYDVRNVIIYTTFLYLQHIRCFPKLYSSKMFVASKHLIQPDWNKLQRLPEWLESLGMIGAQLRSPLSPSIQ